jgi:4-hydroxyacetophenone monooxygenase
MKRMVSEQFIERALNKANPNVLRMALYQQTGDESLLTMRVTGQPLPGGARVEYVLDSECEGLVREKALAYLSAQEPVTALPPCRDVARDLMEKFLGRVITDAEADYGYEELCFEDFSRDVSWQSSPPKTRSEFKVMIVGAGISGIAAAIQLGRLGIDYTIVDRQSDLGGTWEWNDYPEARVDITTFLYQFKFEKNYPWCSHFATRQEIKDYLTHVAEKYGVKQYIRFQTELKEACWNPEAKTWCVNLAAKNGALLEENVNILISCSGLFSTPNVPSINGLSDFEGNVFHSTAWDHSVDLQGKRVGIVGTGSTGSQMVRGIARKCDHLTVFQRTPNWLSPIRNYRGEVSDEEQWLLDSLPYYWHWYVFSVSVSDTHIQGLQDIDEEWHAAGKGVNEKNSAVRQELERYIRKQFPNDPALAERLIPNYPPLARRLVVDNEFYSTLKQPHVDLISDSVDMITRGGVRLRNGNEIPLDVIVLSTGFKVSKYLWPANYYGEGGATPDQLWSKDGARAYMGLTMPGFPNMFVFYGPNSQSRAGGFHSWAEIWSRYMGQLIVHMLENNLQSFDVKRERFDDYNKKMDLEHRKILWELEGVGGYYVNEFGRSGVNMPWTVHEFYAMVQQAQMEDYLWD